MDRELVLKLIGETNRVILEDQIFNLINILEYFRENIIKGREIKDGLRSSVKKLKEINLYVIELKTKLQNVIGYTNSKVYLINYFEGIVLNIQKLIVSIAEKEEKKFIFYTNLLMDIAFKY